MESWNHSESPDEWGILCLMKYNTILLSALNSCKKSHSVLISYLRQKDLMKLYLVPYYGTSRKIEY